MKRTICLFFALSLLFLAGCHSEEPTPSVPPATPTPTAAPPESRAPLPTPSPAPAFYLAFQCPPAGGQLAELLCIPAGAL